MAPRVVAEDELPVEAGSRGELLSAVRGRVNRFIDGQDPASVLDPAALAEVAVLLEAVPDPDVDLEVARACGLLHWCRHLLLDPGDHVQDLRSSLRFLAPVYRSEPAAIPEQARAFFEDSFRAMADRALVLLRHAFGTSSRADLDEAVEATREAMAAAPRDHHARAGMLNNLGAALRVRFERSGSRPDLEEAVQASREAVATTPRDHPARAGRLANLGAVLRVRFEQTGSQDDLDAAVESARAAVASGRSDHPDRAKWLATLVATLGSVFERTGSRADLDEAMEASRAAVTSTPADHPNYPEMLSNLGTTLRTVFEQAGSRADLDEAVEASRAAVTSAPFDHPGRAGMLSNLAAALRVRFEQAGSRADLDEAVEASRAAVTDTPLDHHDRPARLAQMAAALGNRFGQTGGMSDLEEAVEAARAAVDGTPPDHPGRALNLTVLGSALRIRSERTGGMTDLDEAVELGRAAVDMTPSDHPDRAVTLSNLAAALYTLYQRTGSIADLDGAVETGRAAVSATSADNSRRAGWLANLGAALRLHFDRTGSRADLDEAVQVSREAVAAISPDHPDRAGMLSNVGLVLLARFKRTGSLSDLDEAVKAGREAVATTPVDHPNRAAMLSNLLPALRAWFERTGSLSDLEEAVKAGREAVAAISPDHPDRAGMLSNVGLVLLARFKRTGSLSDLDEAVKAGREAVAAISPDHPDRAGWLSNLAAALRARFEHAGSRADLDEAVEAGRAGAGVEGASPRHRVGAARRWGDAAGLGGEWEKAVAGFTVAVEMLGRVVPRSLSRRDQEQLLEELGGLGSEAAACCVQAGLAGRGVELFEQGRGVLLGQALDARTDLTELAQRHPALAERFNELSSELDRADDAGGRAEAAPVGTGPADVAYRAEPPGREARRRELGDAFQRVIGQIRELPGFEGFLHPPRVTELATAAAGGAIVIVNVSRFGSHALIVTDRGVLEPVALDRLTPQAVPERVIGFLNALDFGAEQPLADTLGWLWDVLAGPVLNRLGIGGPPQHGKPWPRVWWCVSGLLSFLPVHAAGRHDTRFDPVPLTVMDRVVSSYTPTVRALAHARRIRRDSGDGGPGALGGGSGMLVVAMPHTPDVGDLPGAVTEAVRLRGLLPGQVTILHGDLRPDEAATLAGAPATRTEVLAALPAARWAHFACHGRSDPANPSASHLLLADHRQRPLTVADVARLRLDAAELAFLSACSTARPGVGLADEAIHLASAFQLAGYRQVIGTLWPIGDRTAAEVATDVYTELFAAGHTRTDTGNAASALHAVTRRLRNRWAASPSVWATYIHSGA